MSDAPKAVFVAALILIGDAVMAQSVSASLGLVVYPGEGQAAAQVAKDEGECHAWSRQSTGVDPANPMAGVQQQQAAPSGGEGAAVGRGAARGAAKGALIGNLADEDAGEYALAGAVIGSARGARERQAQGAQAQSQAEAANQAKAAERLGLFTKAFSACMEGRKYTVR